MGQEEKGGACVRASALLAAYTLCVRGFYFLFFLSLFLSLSLASVSFSRAVAPLPILHPCIVITGVERLRVR
jgi:hypothetical protein